MLIVKKYVVCLVMIAHLFSGCIRLKGNTVYEYVPDLPKGTVPVTVTVETFEDLRPESDRKKTKDIEPVAQKITRKVYDDFKDSQLFEKILSGSDASSDLVVKGRVYSFYWKNRYQWYDFVPYLNLILLFGVPAGRFTGEVELAVDLISKNSGKIIGSYKDHAKKEDTYTGYRSFWGLEAGAETSEAFRLAVQNIKAGILSDKESIIKSLNAEKAL